MGEPNATEIPAAAAADRTSRFRATIMLDSVYEETAPIITYLHYR